MPHSSAVYLIDLLDRCIEPEELGKLRVWASKYGYDRAIPELGGGCIRGFDHASSRVASYNNTRKDESEIRAWYERARALAEQEASQYDHDRTANAPVAATA